MAVIIANFIVFGNAGSQRKGRDLQRYGRDQERLVAGCIPVRGNSREGVQVLMITSSSGSKGLVFPKASTLLFLGMSSEELGPSVREPGTGRLGEKGEGIE